MGDHFVQIGVKWNNGSRLMLVQDKDQFEIIKQVSKNKPKDNDKTIGKISLIMIIAYDSFDKIEKVMKGLK
jgi:hypothetical protein